MITKMKIINKVKLNISTQKYKCLCYNLGLYFSF